MIFFAVASPTPGNSFSSAALALSRSTGVSGEVVLLGFADRLIYRQGEFAGPGAAPPNVTRGVIFVIVEAETPAFDKSAAEEYGRPEMIFFAVAVPTPGKVSRSFSLALFKSISHWSHSLVRRP